MSLDFPGKIRPSQLVTTFGPGSIVDLPHDSVMIMGLEWWPKDPTRYETIHDERLQAWLGLKELHVPVTPQESDGHVPCLPFPVYRVCVVCSSLAPAFYDVSNATYRCPEKDCRGRTYPARLITACEKGHIDDFPWSAWVHGDAGGEAHDLKLISLKRTASLSDLMVTCVTKGCGKKRTLGSALSPDGVSRVVPHCNGKRPWLRDDQECDRKPLGLQRGASNVYFSVPVSSLSIPPWTSPLAARVDDHWSTIAQLQETNPKVLQTVISELFKGEDIDEVWSLIRKRQEIPGKADLRSDEWLAFRNPVPPNERNFQIFPEPVPSGISQWVETLVRVARLREVRVLRGFQRISPPDPEEERKITIVPISRSRLQWLPAVEVFGEGIFFALNKKKLLDWEQLPGVVNRTESLRRVFQHWRSIQGLPTTEMPSPRFVLLHTLNHAIIRQLSLESGYSSASIRERVYSSQDMYGALIYTSASDSEGSLGGLVRQGKPSSFEPLLRNSVTSMLYCSSDPLCAENNPEETNTMNGAACYSCCFLSETSCERTNRLLDRQFVLPSTDSTISYFGDLEAEE